MVYYRHKYTIEECCVLWINEEGYNWKIKENPCGCQVLKVVFGHRFTTPKVKYSLFLIENELSSLISVFLKTWTPSWSVFGGFDLNSVFTCCYCPFCNYSRRTSRDGHRSYDSSGPLWWGGRDGKTKRSTGTPSKIVLLWI